MRKSIHLIGADGHEIFIMEQAMKDQQRKRDEMTWRVPLTTFYPAVEKMEFKLVQGVAGTMVHSVLQAHIRMQYRKSVWNMRAEDLYCIVQTYDQSKVLTIQSIGDMVECQVGNDIYLFWNDRNPQRILDEINYLPHDGIF